MGQTPSKSHQVENSNSRNLSSNDHFVVERELDILRAARNCNTQSLIMIYNHSDYDLVYKNSGTDSGYFFTNITDAFPDNKIVKRNGKGGILCTKKRYIIYI